MDEPDEPDWWERRFVRRLLDTSVGRVSVEGTWFGVHVTHYDDHGEQIRRVWASPDGNLQGIRLPEALRKIGLPSAEADPIARELELRLAALRPEPPPRWRGYWSTAKFVTVFAVPWVIGFVWALQGTARRLLRRST